MVDISFVEPELERRQKLELRLNSGALKGKYTTFIKDFSASRIVVEVPTVDQLYLPVNTGQNLFVEYRRMSARYQFESRVVDRKDDVEPPVLELERPDSVKRIQLRDHLRVPCSIPAKLKIESDVPDPIPPKLEGTIVDLSAGGAKFRAELELPMSTRVNLKFELPILEEEMNDLYGYIIRREEDEVEECYFYGIEFEGVLTDQRKALTQYSYRRQLELQKKDKWVQD